MLSPDFPSGRRPAPTKREEVYAFARPPTVTRAGPDRYAISFATTAPCDVAVCIEEAAEKAPRIVRHLVYGILGANAPEPLARDTLDQTIYWDGKDEEGRYVRDPRACRVRVSLGLHPTFDKVIGWHPKDTTAHREIAAIGADRDGVYVLELSSRNQLRMFDHDANYARTLVPYAADQVGKPPLGSARGGPEPVEGPALNVPLRRTENGRTVPQLTGLGGTAPFAAVGDPCSMAVAAGRIAFSTIGGPHDNRRLLRLRTDGTTGGEPINGAPFAQYDKPSTRLKHPKNLVDIGHIALSPDGKWVYITGQGTSNTRYRTDRYHERPPYAFNAVFRFAWESQDVVMESDSFLGEVSSGAEAGAGSDNAHFNLPQGLATDAQGRLYVADYGNHRIQVFDPDGTYRATIPVKQPQELAVHQKTGAIYVLCYEAARVIFQGQMRLVKIGAFDDPKVLIEKTFDLPGGDSRVTGFTPVMAVDSWSEPTRVWLTVRRGCIQVWSERENGFELFDDFEQDVIKAGLRPHMLGAYKMNRLEVDPVRGHLYYLRTFHLQRCDPEGPGRFADVVVHGASSSVAYQDMDFSRAGLLYLRALRFVARFDPAKSGDSIGRLSPGPDRSPGMLSPDFADGRTVTLGPGAEVPFDYGEEQDLPFHRAPLKGVIKIDALPGANGFDTGFGVGPRGDVIAFMTNYSGREGLLYGREDRYIDNNVLKRFLDEAKNRTFRPAVFPGRYLQAAELVMRWDAKGQPAGVDLVPAAPIQSCGIKTDAVGSIYLGVGANLVVNGRPHAGGALAKFPPQGGRLFGEGDLTKLADLPARPPDFRGYGQRDLWAKDMLWAYPGLDQMVRLGGGQYPCLCATCRFDTDGYGRSFVPKAYQFAVGIVDTNGNEVCEVGRFGNPESPAMKRGDTDIGLAHCSFVAADTDRWLYLNDDGNSRIIRVRLGYHVDARAPIPQ